MTSPSTQNLKALGLWVFFLICCLTFSFLLNVGLRLTLEYLTISPSSVSPSSTLIHSSSNESILKPEYITHDSSLVSPFTHLYGTRLPETSIRNSSKPQTNDSNTTLLRESKRKTPKRSLRMRTKSNSYKGITPHSIQNLKALVLRVFFIICCSTFSFLLNVETHI